jgi:hypothetical protein
MELAAATCPPRTRPYWPGCSTVAVTFWLRSDTPIQQECCILSQMIPRFTEEGLLPPGVHETDLEELKEKMGWSRKGWELFEGFE